MANITGTTTTKPTNISTVGYTLLDSITKPVVTVSNLLASPGTVTAGTVVNDYYLPVVANSVTVADVSYINSTSAVDTYFYKAYKLYKNLLCAQGYDFTADVLKSAGAVVINFNRSLLKQGLSLNSSEPYNLLLNGASSSTKYLWLSNIKNTSSNYTNAYNIYLSTQTTLPTITTSSAIYGYVFPTQGIIVLPLQPTTEATPYIAVANHANAAGLFANAGSMLNVKVFKRSMVTTYFIRIPHNKFNISSNPSWASSSAATNGTTFISGIALFNNEKTMVAIAKLDRALIKNNEKE